MSALPAERIYPVVETDWHGLYGESWQGDLVPEAYSHPAKFSRALVRKIYAHAAEEGWIGRGSTVVDPFGGIAGGALDAMLHGCQWKGCELEARFVELGNQNIALWQSRYSRMPSWGAAELRQGDSRRLSEVFPCGDLAVSSPPFNENKSNQIHGSTKGVWGGTAKDRVKKDYIRPEHPDNLGGLPITEEGFDCAVSSPPYASAQAHPSIGSVNKDGWGTQGKDIVARRGLTAEYGATPGQLGGMKEGSFDAAVSSPPYEATRITAAQSSSVDISAIPETLDSYGIASINRTSADIADFWQASRLILEQLYQVLAPGGHAVFVTKRFVRKKQIVEFSAQWAALCEAVGFRQLHHHRCWLVEHHGSLTNLMGEEVELKTERKSFFRRLAEKKGSPRIDYEDVLCFVKPPLLNTEAA